MFSNPLPSSSIHFSVSFREYANSHYRKEFQKKYKGKQWEYTEKSIFEDLRRLRAPNNTTQFSMQVDQLKHKDDYWLIKYDFRIAGKKESTKNSGNRIVAFINNNINKLDILLIYSKTDLPKNIKETAFIERTIKEVYPEITKLF
ncbi:MAG: hypothetical protein K5906_04660 [Bacilli bacterium]|nr:hypothetical protein [Bacilli bacterium]